ncbi:hypothetical protein HWI79_1040 [Cryptosporidium felis]|nr:hypothetical protein HWI79_1040 [Cryptosporidium felis]
MESGDAFVIHEKEASGQEFITEGCKEENQTVENLKKENNFLKEQLRNLKENSISVSLNSGERDQLSVLTEQLAQERNENERLQENVNGLQESLVKNRQELLEFQQRVYESEILSSRCQHENKILEQEKNSLQEFLKKNQEEVAVLESRLKELHTSKNNILLDSTKKISGLEVSCRDFEHKISLMQKSRDELELELSKTCDELRRVKSELEFAKGHYEGKIKIKEEAIRLKEEQVQQIQGLLDMSISTAQNLESEIEKLKHHQQEEDNRENDLLKGKTCGSSDGVTFNGKELNDKQALEILIEIFGETYIDEVSSISRIDGSDIPREGRSGRRILIDLLTQLEDYQNNLEELRQQNHILKTELKETQYHLKVTVPDFELTRQNYESLQAENNFAIQQIQSLTQERRNLMHEVSELKTLWKHETKKREIYEDQCKMITFQYNKIVNNTDNSQENMTSVHETETFDQKKSPTNYNAGVISGIQSDLMEQNTQLKIQISRLIEGIELESQIQIRKLNSDLTSCRDQFEKIQNERDELVSQYQSLITNLEEENKRLKEENQAMKEKELEKKSHPGPLDRDSPSENLASPNVFVKQLGEVTEMCKTLSEKLTNEIESSTQCKSELSRYKAQCEYMESLGERNRKRLDELFEERDRLYKELNDLKLQQDAKELELQELKEKITGKDSEIFDLKRENEYQKQNISNLNGHITDLKSDIEQAIKQKSQDNTLQRDMISQLQAELEGKCVEINTIRKSQDAILQREFEESQRLRQQLRAEFEKFQQIELKLKEIQIEKENLEKQLLEIKERVGTYGTDGAPSSPNDAGANSGYMKLIGVPPKDASIREPILSGIQEEEGPDQQDELLKTRNQLEESKKLQNYWRELVQSLEKQLEARNKEQDELKLREESLKKCLESTKDEARVLQEESQREITRLNESVSAMALRISSIDEEISKREGVIKEDLSHANEENIILNKKVQELTQIEQDLRSQYQNIVRMHSIDIERLQNATKQCIELKEEFNSLKNQSKKSDNENTTLIMELQNDIVQLKRQLESCTKKYEIAKRDYHNLKEIVSKLKNEQLPQELEGILETISQMDCETEDKDDRRLSIQSVGSNGITPNSSATASLMLMRRVQTLTNSVEELDAKLDESKIEIQRLTFERKSLREENELLQKRLTDELERSSEFASKAEANENALIRLGELVTLREANDRLRRELIQATERHANLEKQLEFESRQLDPLKCEISKLEAQVEGLRALCEEKSTLSKSWEEQYNRILLNYENVNLEEIAQIKDEVGKLKAANEELRESLNLKSMEIEKLHSEKQDQVSNEELQLTKQQMEQLRKVYMSTNQKLKEERNKCTRLENDLKKLNSSNGAASQSQIQVQSGGSSGSSNSNSQESNPQGPKLTPQEVKNISRATGNLVNVVLKLAKFSILRLETEGSSERPQLPSKNTQSSTDSLKHGRNQDELGNSSLPKKRPSREGSNSKETHETS